jgi:hypothetical protein
LCRNKKKIVAQKINVILFFDIEFFKYFFRILHEASSSWLKFLHNFQKHPVYKLVTIKFFLSGIQLIFYDTRTFIRQGLTTCFLSQGTQKLWHKFKRISPKEFFNYEIKLVCEDNKTINSLTEYTEEGARLSKPASCFLLCKKMCTKYLRVIAR